MTTNFAEQATRLRVDQPWRAAAACIGRSDVMDPPADEIAQARRYGLETALWEPAKDICRSCPVLVQCRSWAVTLPGTADVSGVCGGLTEDERKTERRRRAHLAPAKPPPPPLPDGHLRCTRCGDVKPDEAFAAEPRNIRRRGRRSHCRDCVSDYQRGRARRRT